MRVTQQYYIVDGEKMLAPEERRETVDYVVAKVTEKGRLALDSGAVQRYEYSLPYCSLTVFSMRQRDFDPVVEIAENFGDPLFQPEGWQERSFDGLRTIYRGGSNGLDEVALQGIYAPNANGDMLPPAESLRRSRRLTDGRHLIRQDQERFDAFLKYAQREL